MSVLNGCKLTYFNLTGRGEATRLALAIGNIPFEDHRIEFADWKEWKPKTPWGSLPSITLKDGTEIAQQRAILRMVGKEAGLYPTDIVASALVDSVMDAAEDFFPKTTAIGAGTEKAEKEAARAKECQPGGIVYGMMEKVDGFIAKNGKNGHAVGDALTIADLFLYCQFNLLVSGMFDGVPPDASDGFAHILTLRKMVRSHPAVEAWYDGLKDEYKAKLAASYGKLE